MDDIERNQTINKGKTKIIGIVLLLLISSYFLLGSAVFPLLASMSESNIVDSNKIYVGSNVVIAFHNDTYEAIKNIYAEGLAQEFAACLKGNKIGDEYHIDEIIRPIVIDQSFNHIKFRSCPLDTLILLHSHPHKRCIASNQDIITLQKIKENNNNSLIMVMCGMGEFSVYD